MIDGGNISAWILAGAAAGALLTWLVMRTMHRDAYQHGFDHGRAEGEAELATLTERLAGGARQLDELKAALAAGEAALARLREDLRHEAEARAIAGAAAQRVPELESACAALRN